MSLPRSDTDEVVRRTKVLAVVKALPGVGTVRAGQLLEQAQIADPPPPPGCLVVFDIP